MQSSAKSLSPVTLKMQVVDKQWALPVPLEVVLDNQPLWDALGLTLSDEDRTADTAGLHIVLCDAEEGGYYFTVATLSEPSQIIGELHPDCSPDWGAEKQLRHALKQGKFWLGDGNVDTPRRLISEAGILSALGITLTGSVRFADGVRTDDERHSKAKPSKSKGIPAPVDACPNVDSTQTNAALAAPDAIAPEFWEQIDRCIAPLRGDEVGALLCLSGSEPQMRIAHVAAVEAPYFHAVLGVREMPTTDESILDAYGLEHRPEGGKPLQYMEFRAENNAEGQIFFAVTQGRLNQIGCLTPMIPLAMNVSDLTPRQMAIALLHCLRHGTYVSEQAVSGAGLTDEHLLSKFKITPGRVAAMAVTDELPEIRSRASALPRLSDPVSDADDTELALALAASMQDQGGSGLGSDDAAGCDH